MTTLEEYKVVLWNWEKKLEEEEMKGMATLWDLRRMEKDFERVESAYKLL